MNEVQDAYDRAHEPQGQHDLVKEWFVGKSLRLLNTMRSLEGTDIPDTLNIESEYNELRKSTQTSLSERVVSLMTIDEELSRQQIPDISKIVTKNERTGAYVLNWEEFTIEKLIGGRMELLSEENQDDMFLACTRYIQPRALAIHEKLFRDILEKDNQKFLSMYQSHFRILSQPSLFEWFIDEHNLGNSMFAFTIAVCYFEHGLQDALLSLHAANKDKKKIFLFNDNLPKLNEFLMMPELAQIIGKDELFMIRAFIGPLNSLNLRNVTLHGFLTEKEFHPAYTSFLLLIMTSISDKLSHLLKEPSDYLNYRLKSHPEPENQLDVYKMERQVVTPQQVEMDKDGILELFSRSTFIIPQFIPSHWKPALEEYIHGRYYHFLMYIFPAIEHSIRRIFVSVNDCAHRLLTAERNSLYTTLDILLSTIPSQYLPDGQNRIFDVFDGPCINSIFDMLIWPDSPRVRDLLSHGSILPHLITKDVADRMLILLISLCVRFDVKNNTSLEYQTSLPVSVQESVNYLYNEYHALFHPKNMAQKSLTHAHQRCKEFIDMADEECIIKLHQGTESTMTNDQKRMTDVLLQHVKPFTDQIKKLDLDRHEYTRTLNSVTLSEREYKKYARLCEVGRLLGDSFVKLDSMITKETQKRKLGNLRSMLDYLPVMKAVLELFMLFALMDFYQGPINSALSNALFGSVGAIESSIRTNKWHRAFDLCVTILLDASDSYELTPQLTKKEAKRMYQDYSKFL